MTVMHAINWSRGGRCSWSCTPCVIRHTTAYATRDKNRVTCDRCVEVEVQRLRDRERGGR